MINRKLKSSSFVAVSILFSALFWGAGAHAETYTWTGAIDSELTTLENWNVDGTPATSFGTEMDMVLGSGMTAQQATGEFHFGMWPSEGTTVKSLTVAGNLTLNQLRMQSTAFSATVAGGQMTISDLSNDGTITVNNGTFISNGTVYSAGTLQLENSTLNSNSWHLYSLNNNRILLKGNSTGTFGNIMYRNDATGNFMRIQAGSTAKLKGSVGVYDEAVNATGNIVVEAGGQLTLDSTQTTFNNTNFSIAGTGVGGNGALFFANNAGIIDSTTSVMLTGNASVSVAEGKVGTIGTGISGNATLTKVGTGELKLTATNSYTGDTVISDGKLTISDAGTLGSGHLIVDNGTFDFSGGDTVQTVRNVYVGKTNGHTGTMYVRSGTLKIGGDDFYVGGENNASLNQTTVGYLYQSGGLLDVNGKWLNVGERGVGTYEMTGGELQALMFVVGRRGNGTFHITNGKVTTSSLIVGCQWDGITSTGVVNQDGGTVITNTLSYGSTANTSGTYNLSGGTLTTADVRGNNSSQTRALNISGTGQLVITGGGGILDLTRFSIAGNGGDGGGALVVNGYMGVNANITLTGNATICVDDSSKLMNLRADLTSEGGNHTLTKIGAGKLAFLRATHFGGDTVVNGGTLSTEESGNIGTGRHYIHSGTLELNSNVTHDVEGNIHIGSMNNSTGTMLVKQGTLNFTGQDIYIGGYNNTFNSTAVGILRQTGGTLNGNGHWFNVGEFGTGTYEISDGSMTTGYFCIGRRGTGTLNMSGNASITVWELNLGGRWDSGMKTIGTVNQSGGTLNVNDNLIYGSNTGTEAVYNLSGGTLTVSQITGNTASAKREMNISGSGQLILRENGNVTDLTQFTLAGMGGDGRGALVATGNMNCTTGITLTGDAGICVNADGGILDALAGITEEGGSFSLTKTGAGVLRLSGENTYSGGTIVKEGTLAVGNGASLAGDVELVFSSETQHGIFSVENGDFSRTEFLKFATSNGYRLAPGVEYHVASAFPNLGEDFDYSTLLTPEMQYTYDLSYVNGGLRLSVDTSAVPEPTTWVLLALGFMGIVSARRMKA